MKADLGSRLARLDYAPSGIIERVAWDDAISVAGIVLENSNVLSTNTLIAIAEAKGQDHLHAISGRKELPEAVTDIIVERGERKVIRRLAANPTARFSDTGFSGMVAHAEVDDELAELVGLRSDLPISFLRDLLRRATDAVRARLAKIAPANLKHEIEQILKAIMAGPTAAKDFDRAEAIVRRMKGLNELNDASISDFARAKKFDEVAASLAILNNSAPTEIMARVLGGPRADMVLIPCKSARLDWRTVEVILQHRPTQNCIDDATLAVAVRDYGKLSPETAERTLRFWLLHDKTEK